MLFRRRRGLLPQILLFSFIIWIIYMFYAPMGKNDSESDREVPPGVFIQNKNPEEDPRGIDPGAPDRHPVGDNNVREWHNVLREKKEDLLGMKQHEEGQNIQEEQNAQQGQNIQQGHDVQEGQHVDQAVESHAEHKDDSKLEPPQQIDLPENKDKPGEGGKPVIIDKEKLSPEERKIYDLGYKNNAYNQYASDMISLHRSLEDNRDELCKTMKYRPNSKLPNTSVVIIFHNEGWSVLLRTVHSVIDRTPPELLHEVIMVDDKSDMDHLQKPLDDYVDALPKVKIVRAQRREGLIRARLLGAAKATGEVLVFLDSHCEAGVGWYEPMAERIADNWSNVLTPIIEVINDDTLEYKTSKAKDVQVGGFTWNLVFTWHGVPKKDRANRSSEVAPIISPTMAGGLFAISRKYFEYIGTYDPGMEIWGGENLEMSFRIWMCGGRLETIPCSHIGHIFRKRSPYSWKSDKGTNLVKRNNVRLAEVWLDEYKEFYYDKIGHSLGEYGDITSRKKLREKLQCKSFDWFLKTIYPTLFTPKDSLNRGEIANEAQAVCVDASIEKSSLHKAVIGYQCHKQGGNQGKSSQLWYMSNTGEIRRDDVCLDYSAGAKSPVTWECHGSLGNQEWKYTEQRHIVHVGSKQCLELDGTGKILIVSICDDSNPRQRWNWPKNEQKQ